VRWVTSGTLYQQASERLRQLIMNTGGHTNSTARSLDARLRENGYLTDSQLRLLTDMTADMERRGSAMREQFGRALRNPFGSTAIDW
jgi:hypothetical protein